MKVKLRNRSAAPGFIAEATSFRKLSRARLRSVEEFVDWHARDAGKRPRSDLDLLLETI